LKKLRRTREVPNEDPNVLTAQALGIFGLTVGISSKVKGMPTTVSIVMKMGKNSKSM
jgi:hypothetical protein